MCNLGLTSSLKCILGLPSPCNTRLVWNMKVAHALVPYLKRVPSVWPTALSGWAALEHPTLRGREERGTAHRCSATDCRRGPVLHPTDRTREAASMSRWELFHLHHLHLKQQFYFIYLPKLQCITCLSIAISVWNIKSQVSLRTLCIYFKILPDKLNYTLLSQSYCCNITVYQTKVKRHRFCLFLKSNKQCIWFDVSFA